MTIILEPSPTGHYLELYPKKNLVLGAHNLNAGEELVAVIEKVENGEIKDHKGKDKEVVFLYFDSKHKIMPMCLNITNARIIEGLYGEKWASWIGKSVQIYKGEVRSPSGGMTQGLQIQAFIPETASDPVDTYKDKLRACKSMGQLAAVYKAIPIHIKNRCAGVKDEMKGKIDA